MGLPEHAFGFLSPLSPGDTTDEFLEQFAYDCVRPGSQMSDAAIFADATGSPVDAPLYSTREREQARQFLMEAFRAAGMKGELTDANRPLPPLSRPSGNEETD